MKRAYELDPRAVGIFYRRPGGAYVTVSDGVVWEWTAGQGRKAWIRRRLKKFPADATYASREVPDDLVREVCRRLEDLWTYDLVRGQEHAEETP